MTEDTAKRVTIDKVKVDESTTAYTTTASKGMQTTDVLDALTGALAGVIKHESVRLDVNPEKLAEHVLEVLAAQLAVGQTYGSNTLN